MFVSDLATPARPLGRHYSLARARDPVAPRPLTAAAGPWRHPVLAWHSNRCVPCVSVVRPSGVYMLGRPGWREPLCLTPSTLKHSRTLLHLLAQRLPLSEWPRCSTESAAHDSTTTSYYMFFNTGPTSLPTKCARVRQRCACGSQGTRERATRRQTADSTTVPSRQ